MFISHHTLPISFLKDIVHMVYKEAMVSQVVFRPPEQEKVLSTPFVEERRYPWVFREQAPKKTEETRKHVGRRPKVTVPAPVKRYRQLRRNARERERQGRLNSAFDVLRGVIPDYLSGKGPEGKLTQIETLRLATHYIEALSELLDDNETKTMSEFCGCGYFRENEQFSFSDLSCLTDI
ncbi:hypothetical protein ACROYT_G028272 [Oculina patagonica]